MKVFQFSALQVCILKSITLPALLVCFTVLLVSEAGAVITVDPNSTGATDIIQDPAGAAILIANPVTDPLDLIDDDIAIGNTTDGALDISSGGLLSNGSAIVGNQAGSTGAVTVDGAGTQWNNAGSLRVGQAGNGTVHISNGAVVTSTLPSGVTLAVSGVGFAGGTTSSITVDGTGSVWDDSSTRIDIGDEGAGTLTISNGGLVTAAGAVVVNPGISGSKIVFNNGTLTSQAVFAAAADLEGTGTINTEGWAYDTDYVFNTSGDQQHQLILNSLPGQNVTVNIDHSFGAGRIGAGYDGTATVTIQNGVFLESNRGYAGYRVGSNGTINVDGLGTTWEDTGDFFQIGFRGTGALNIQNGATLNTAGLSVLGAQANSNGTVTVDGTDSTWNNSDQLNIGTVGTGTLNIQNGGTVFSTASFIGGNAGAVGVATVDGAGSTWTHSTDLVVGNTGDGTLNVSNGGSITNNFGILGLDEGAKGTATVDGVGSNWTGVNQFYVGFDGNGTLNLQNGGSISVTDTFIALNATASGNATVSGTGTNWDMSGFLVIGQSGIGTLKIENGGLVTVGTDVVVANVAGSQGTLEFGIGNDGAGLLDITGDFLIGVDSTLSVSIDTAILPAVGAQFTVVEFDGTGTDVFANEPTATAVGDVLVNWNVLYNTNDVTLEVASTVLAGDFDELGDVEASDFGLWSSGYGTATGALHTSGDADTDGDVDGADFLIWQSQFGQSFPSNGNLSASTVPEPATWSLFMVAAFALAWLRKRQQ